MAGKFNFDLDNDKGAPAPVKRKRGLFADLNNSSSSPVDVDSSDVPNDSYSDELNNNSDDSTILESITPESPEEDSIVSDVEPEIRFNFDKPRSERFGGRGSGSLPRFGVGADVQGGFGAGFDEGDFDSDVDVDSVSSANEIDVDFLGARSLVEEVDSVEGSEIEDVSNVVENVDDGLINDSIKDSDSNIENDNVSGDGVPDLVNPFLVDDEEDFEEIVVPSEINELENDSVSLQGDFENVGSYDPVNPLLSDESDDEDEIFVGSFDKKVYQDDVNDSVDSSVVVGSESTVESDGLINDVLKDKVRNFASRPVFDESRGNDDVSVEPVDPADFDSVVVKKKRGPLAVDSGFARKNITEVIVDSSENKKRDSSGSNNAGVDPSRKLNRHVRENGRLNGKELEFFKNLGTSKNSLDSDRIKLLRGRVDGDSSAAARKARNILYSQAIGGSELLKRGSKVRFSEKDRDTLQLLALFRYMTASHISRAFSQSIRTAKDRLGRLRMQGLVIDKKIFGAEPIWYLTEAGMLLSGYDLKRVTESGLTYSMFPHQFTVNHVAANVWGANVNVLNLSDFPARNRVNEKGEKVFGETLISELEIQSALSKMRGFDKADTFVPTLKSNIEVAFTRWERSGGVEFGPSPEMSLGNEYMWALFPPASLRVAYHPPDLILKRDRNADGSPESIAVEIELNSKASDQYEKILRAYRADDRIFKKVIWVCKNVSPARKLEQVGKELGLIQDGRLEIIPVLTEDGVFKGRDLWTL